MYVMQYGLLPPVRHANVAWNQMRLGVVYQATLLGIEVKKRDALRALQKAHDAAGSDELKAAEAEKTAATQAVLACKKGLKAERIKTHSKKNDPALMEQLLSLQAAEKEAGAKLRLARAAGRKDPAYKTAVERIVAEAKERVLAARKASNVWWGSYLRAEKAAQAAVEKMPLWENDEPKNPRFPRWSKEEGGSLGVQCQNGMAVEDAVVHVPLDLDVDILASDEVVFGKRTKTLKPDEFRWRRRTATRVHGGGSNRELDPVEPLRSREPAEVWWDAVQERGLVIPNAPSALFQIRLLPAASTTFKDLPIRDGGGTLAHTPSESKSRRAELRMQVTSDDLGPVYVTWPMIYHLPLPAGFEVAEVSVRGSKEANAQVWAVNVGVRPPPPIVDLEEQIKNIREHGTVLGVDENGKLVGEPVKHPATAITQREERIARIRSHPLAVARKKPCGQGVVGVNVGWRQIGDEIRVATWVSEDGQHGELRLPHSLCVILGRHKQLDQIRDLAFNRTILWLADWAKSNPADVPKWMEKDVQYLHQWKSKARLTRLVQRCREIAFDTDGEAQNAFCAWVDFHDVPGWALNDETASKVLGRWRTSKKYLTCDDAKRRLLAERVSDWPLAEVYFRLELWRCQENHLWEWSVHERGHAIRCRRELFRVFSADLATRFGTVVFDEFDLTEVARHEEVGEPGEQEDKKLTAAEFHRQIAAVGTFRIIAGYAFTSRGGQNSKVPSKNNTHLCCTCHTLNVFDAAECVDFTCKGCGKVQDQDINAATNTCMRYLQPETYGDPPRPVAEKTTVIHGGRWGKRKMAVKVKALGEA